MSKASSSQPEARLRLRVTSAAENHIRGGHPWVFSESIAEANRAGKLGELAVIYDKRDRFLAIGLYDPESPLRVRILHTGDPVTIDASWFAQRLHRAVELRTELFKGDKQTNAFRLINGESDGWPGLVLDKYDRTLVVKLYTASWFSRLEMILDPLGQELRPNQIMLRLSRNIQEYAQAKFGRNDGERLGLNSPAGTPALPGEVCFLETGIRFEADVARGQKTGFFLDQRENRRQIERLAKGHTVLNAFSFSGGFSLYAARGGAKSVLDLDISANALESARRNFALNRDNKKISACTHESIQADAFDWLAATKRRFGLVILDPPSLARRAREREQALQAYARLITNGIRCTQRGGILLACSCSAHVNEAEFFEVARQSVQRSKRVFRELMTTGQPPDHPATFPEARYLKGIYFQL